MSRRTPHCSLAIPFLLRFFIWIFDFLFPFWTFFSLFILNPDEIEKKKIFRRKILVFAIFLHFCVNFWAFAFGNFVTRHSAHILVQFSARISTLLTENLRKISSDKSFSGFSPSRLDSSSHTEENFWWAVNFSYNFPFHSLWERFVEFARWNHNTREGGWGCEGGGWAVPCGWKRVFYLFFVFVGWRDKKNKKCKCEKCFGEFLRKMFWKGDFSWKKFALLNELWIILEKNIITEL